MGTSLKLRSSRIKTVRPGGIVEQRQIRALLRAVRQ
jgi:hypothetical protein